MNSNSSYIFIAQSWFQVPSVIRDNSNVHILFDQPRDKLVRYHNQLATDLDKDDLKRYFRYVLDRAKRDKRGPGFLFLTNIPSVPVEGRIRFRFGNPITEMDVDVDR